jgi:hypothetical protein
MRKIILFGCLLAISFSCSQTEEKPLLIAEKEDISKLFNVTESTDRVGLMSQFDVSYININKSESDVTYSFETNARLKIRESEFKLSSLRFTSSNGRFFRKGFEDIYLFLENDIPKIFFEDQTYNLNEYSVSFSASNVEILIIAYLELKASNETRSSSNNNLKISLEEPCSLLDQVYLTSTAISQSVAVSDLEWAIESGNYNEGCSLIGGIDVSCFTDEHFCIASQGYCCNSIT